MSDWLSFTLSDIKTDIVLTTRRDLPDKRAKPAGMLGAEIWSKIGGSAPANDSDYAMVALDTSSPYVVSYPMTDAGKKVWYRLRWVTTAGEKGGWGETVEATING